MNSHQRSVYSKWINWKLNRNIGETMKTLMQGKQSWPLKIAWKNLLRRQETIGFHDVTVTFPGRYARHTYGCRRNNRTILTTNEIPTNLFAACQDTIPPSKQPMRFSKIHLQYDKQNRSTEGCSRLKRSVDMTSSGKNGLNIRTKLNASPKWDRTRCPEE